MILKYAYVYNLWVTKYNPLIIKLIIYWYYIVI